MSKPKLGDKVLFHFIDSHGEPNRIRDAYVIGVSSTTELDLSVSFLREDFFASNPDVIQRRVPKATQDPPESGSWTEDTAS